MPTKYNTMSYRTPTAAAFTRGEAVFSYNAVPFFTESRRSSPPSVFSWCVHPFSPMPFKFSSSSVGHDPRSDFNMFYQNSNTCVGWSLAVEAVRVFFSLLFPGGCSTWRVFHVR
ncbi:unnamed protein product [Ectocarpus sp. 4 AP-2014]